MMHLDNRRRGHENIVFEIPPHFTYMSLHLALSELNLVHEPITINKVLS
jgi:hypothetical protein